MKKLLVILLIVLPGSCLFSQTGILSLDSCLMVAERRHPSSKLFVLYDEQFSLKSKSVKTAWYPSMTLNAQATWQNEVTNIDIDLPMLTSPLTDMSKDQYKISLDVRQTIWDGGSSKALLGVEQATVISEQEKVRRDLFRFKEQLVDVYFSILKLQSQQEVLTVKKWQLLLKIEDMEKAVNSGVVLPDAIDALNAEKLVVDQKIIELDYEIAALRMMLSQYLGNPVGESVSFTLPSPDVVPLPESKTCDEIYLTAMKNQLAGNEKLLNTVLMPKIYAFGQMGYGRPGLNMLSNDFEPFLIVGARLVWTPFDWGKTRADKQQIQVQQRIVDTQIEQLNYQQKALLDAQLQRIEKCEKLLEKDEEIISLKHNISVASASKLDNGTITTSEYLNALNEEQAARSNFELHRIMLSEAAVKYNLLQGIMYKN